MSMQNLRHSFFIAARSRSRRFPNRGHLAITTAKISTVNAGRESRIPTTTTFTLPYVFGQQLRSFSSYQQHQQQHQVKKIALVLGSNGALGSSIATHLKEYHNCLVIGADTKINPDADLDAFLPLSPDSLDLTKDLQSGLKTLYDEEDEHDKLILDAIICANGGFAMDDSHSDNNSQMNAHHRMMQMNYHPIIAASKLLPQYMTVNNGLFLVFGATAALQPSPPNMTAYGSSKAAAHYFVQSLGAMSKKSLQSAAKKNDPKRKFVRKKNEYLDTMTAVGMLPSMLDTERNRMDMPDEDPKKVELWTKPVDIAEEVGKWVNDPDFRPHSGSLVKVLTKRARDGIKTEFHLVR